eukprot:UN24291
MNGGLTAEMMAEISGFFMLFQEDPSNEKTNFDVDYHYDVNALLNEQRKTGFEEVSKDVQQRIEQLEIQKKTIEEQFTKLKEESKKSNLKRKLAESTLQHLESEIAPEYYQSLRTYAKARYAECKIQKDANEKLTKKYELMAQAFVDLRRALDVSEDKINTYMQENEHLREKNEKLSLEANVSKVQTQSLRLHLNSLKDQV